ncbi:MAG: aldehyde dehydrogenase family protein [Alphaproteobacteria bacterium]
MNARHFIDGAWAEPADGEVFQTIDPSTEAPIQEVARGSDADVERAVDAASRAMKGPWRDTAPVDRGRALLRLARKIRENKEALAALEARDVGKPISAARGDVEGVIATLVYNAGAADKMEGRTIPLGREVVDFTLMEPLGVTAHIVPWNFPLGMAMRSLAPALAAGCTAVLKPAEQSPLTALKLGELATASGLPRGVVNVVTGFGEEAGAALVRHPKVRGVTFTGSVETGRAVMAGAAAGVKPVVLELGGKNPMLVFADADLERAAADALEGGFDNSGQVCSSASRLLVEQSVAERFTEMLCAKAAALRTGPPMDDPDLGPLVSAEQLQKVMGYLENAPRDGARRRLGGVRPAGLERGYFVAPTVFDQVAPESRIAREEIFGPVVTITPFDREEDALEIANGLGYGLAAGVHTRDISRAMRLAQDLEAGSVWINGWFMGGVQAPTGGIKDSGIGRERGLPGVANYLSVKNVAIRI